MFPSTFSSQIHNFLSLNLLVKQFDNTFQRAIALLRPAIFEILVYTFVIATSCIWHAENAAGNSFAMLVLKGIPALSLSMRCFYHIFQQRKQTRGTSASDDTTLLKRVGSFPIEVLHLYFNL